MVEVWTWLKFNPPRGLRCPHGMVVPTGDIDAMVLRCSRWRLHRTHHTNVQHDAAGKLRGACWQRVGWAERFAHGDHPVPR